jgi:hypothetical protein
MSTLLPDQRNDHYLQEAERSGIHQPILAALYHVHASPLLVDGETGLGISPANRVSLIQVNTFSQQVHYAAKAIRALTESLIAQGVQGIDLWNTEQGCYTDQFLKRVASGYAPKANEATTARLEACNFDKLRHAYLTQKETAFKRENLPHNLTYLEQALVTFITQIPETYMGLPNQRDALLEVVYIWKKLDTRQEAIAFLVPKEKVTLAREDESLLDIPLKQFIQQVVSSYQAYPYQREALLRLVQLWRQLATREEAIVSLQNNTCPEENLSIIDPALMAFVGRLPDYYQGIGSQRNSLTETYRLWRKLENRATVLTSLGINPALLKNSSSDRKSMVKLATQLDRELMTFVRRLPGEYRELDYQREALIRLIQLWRNLPDRNKTIQSLLEDQKRLNQGLRDGIDAPPKPVPVVIPKRPDSWTPDNIQLWASIIVNGNFTWAEATGGGTRLPPNQEAVDAIVRLAKLAQQARDRLGRPFMITSWYGVPSINCSVGGTHTDRHLVGDAMDFVCEGLTGNQVYWFLEPWWPGGLARYSKYPNLCHIDARSYRARWIN